jgi:hypothetical protein
MATPPGAISIVNGFPAAISYEMLISSSTGKPTIRLLVLPDERTREARRVEDQTVAEIEAMRDRRLQAVEVRDRLLQPAKRLP